jgi:ribonuclease BN (tRNA processing enzyme)
LRLVPGADVLVLECSCQGVEVHLSAADVAAVARHASPGAQVIVTHLDDRDNVNALAGLHVAADLKRYRF